MFTGIIEEIGTITHVAEERRGRLLTIATVERFADLNVDHSISFNGVCLTIVAVQANGFRVQVVPETLRKTTAGEWRVGTRINLERALRADSRLGGHFVQGHVDAVADVAGVDSAPDDWLLSVKVPPAFVRYVVLHGSVALDGVSLTVARWRAPLATVALILHTRRHTTLSDRRPGDRLNLEVDVLGKYVESLLAQPQRTLSEERLRQWGYAASNLGRNAHESI